jgi:hypothetical protein
VQCTVHNINLDMPVSSSTAFYNSNLKPDSHTQTQINGSTDSDDADPKTSDSE